jgi:hypothetical protein
LAGEAGLECAAKKPGLKRLAIQTALNSGRGGALFELQNAADYELSL